MIRRLNSDISGTMGRMVAALMLGLAQIEWEDWRDRQATGIAFARRNGISRRGETDRAIADYDEAIRLDPKFALAYNNRGNIYARLFRFRPQRTPWYTGR